MQENILFIDGDESLQNTVRKILRETCNVISATSLKDADEELHKNHFDLILLETTMHDGNGFSFFTKLKNQEFTAKIPIIFISSQTESTQEIMGLSLGAEDYILKPIEEARFKARLESRLKLINLRKQQEMFLFKGNLKLSLSKQRVTLLQNGKEEPISLTPVEFKLLFHLLRHEGHVFTREQLLTSVWNNNAEVFDRTVDMHISKLRKKITKSEFQIKAVHGTGYRLFKSTSKI